MLTKYVADVGTDLLKTGGWWQWASLTSLKFIVAAIFAGIYVCCFKFNLKSSENILEFHVLISNDCILYVYNTWKTKQTVDSIKLKYN